jgi:hypothetical protein
MFSKLIPFCSKWVAKYELLLSWVFFVLTTYKSNLPNNHKKQAPRFCGA